MNEKTVRVDSMKRGQVFRDTNGALWTYERVDGGYSGAHHATREDGYQSKFVGCAELELVPSR